MTATERRDYFAAHAPIEPQSWFQPAMTSERPAPRWKDGVARQYEEPVNQSEMWEWDREWRRQNAVQWPWVWADALLASHLANAEATS